MICKYFSPSVGCLFIFVDDFFVAQKVYVLSHILCCFLNVLCSKLFFPTTHEHCCLRGLWTSVMLISTKDKLVSVKAKPALLWGNQT